MTRSAQGFTLVELACSSVVAVCALAMATLVQDDKQERSREQQDAWNVKGIGSCMVFWANQGDNRYPLPSEVDRDNTTVAAKRLAKNTTPNIFSLMIFQGLMPPSLLITPTETNGAIIEDEDFVFEAPPEANRPELAHWDPSFDADFTDGHGNVSYAHLIPSGNGLYEWRDMSPNHHPIVMTRGPEIAGIEVQADKSVRPKLATPMSKTLSFFPQEGVEAGNAWSTTVVGYDLSVSFWQNRIEGLPDGNSFRAIAGEQSKPHFIHGRYNRILKNRGYKYQPDLLTFNEPDQKDNLFLGIFTTAGEKPSDFTPIWD